MMINYFQLPRDTDQDKNSGGNCAQGMGYSGGWWYKNCMNTHPAGTSSTTKTSGWKYVVYYYGGDRGAGTYSYAEAEFLLVPN